MNVQRHKAIGSGERFGQIPEAPTEYLLDETHNSIYWVIHVGFM